jgi:hypothetical protein
MNKKIKVNDYMEMMARIFPDKNNIINVTF